MNTLKLLKYALSGCVFLILACAQKKQNTPTTNSERPNILLFIGDDLMWRDIGPYGNKDVITPHLDAFAKEGMSFDNMFTTTAMCAPTRQQILTGLYPVRSGAYPNHSWVRDGVKSVGHYFKEMGYEVALIGKQHYGPDESYPIHYLGGRQHDDGKNGADIDLDKIKSIVNSDQPFFLIIAQNQPHTPWNRGDASQYDADKLEVGEYMVDAHETRERLTRYYAEITYMDSLFGKTVKHLKDAGKKENTITMFTSEQGFSFPFGKWTNYDLGLKTGFIARWPGKIEANTRNNAMVQYVDILPTLIDAVGGDASGYDTGISDAYGYRGFDGNSFIQALLDGKDDYRNYVYGAQTTRGIFWGSATYPVRSVRSDSFKYIRNLSADSSFYNTVVVRDDIIDAWKAHAENEEQRQWVERYKNRPAEELYDIVNDPYELHNLAANPKFDKVKEELRIKLENWMKQQGDEGVKTELEALEHMSPGHENWKPYHGY